MQGTILLVDDEPSILNALERVLRPEVSRILKAPSGQAAVGLVELDPKIDIIICDMRMAGMDGAETLNKIASIRPDTIRIALSAQTDAATVIDCVNRAQIHRFIVKPWNDDELKTIVLDAMQSRWLGREHNNLQAEQEEQCRKLRTENQELSANLQRQTEELASAKSIAEQTIQSVRLLMARLMDAYSPGLRGHGRRVANLAVQLARLIGRPEYEVAEIETAALLHDLGKVSLPTEIMQKHVDTMSAEEKEIYHTHVITGYEILRQTEGFEAIAKVIRHHHESVNGNGYPDKLSDKDIPLASRIIAIADIYDRYRYPPGTSVLGSRTKAEKVLTMGSGSRYDARLVAKFLEADIPNFTEEGEHEVEIPSDSMVAGMVLSRDIQNSLGKSLVRKGTVLSDEIIRQLRHNVGFDPVLSRVVVLKDSVPQVEADKNTEQASTDEERQRGLVVVVDDEQHVLNALRRELRSSGYDVETFRNPIDALKQLRMETNVYALITDYSMPTVRGDRFLVQVQKEFPNLPCLVISGHITRDTVVLLGKSAKITRMLPKPWDRDVLIQTLQELGARNEF